MSTCWKSMGAWSYHNANYELDGDIKTRPKQKVGLPCLHCFLLQGRRIMYLVLDCVASEHNSYSYHLTLLWMRGCSYSKWIQVKFNRPFTTWQQHYWRCLYLDDIQPLIAECQNVYSWCYLVSYSLHHKCIQLAYQEIYSVYNNLNIKLLIKFNFSW